MKLSDEGFPITAHTSSHFSTTWHLKISTLFLVLQTFSMNVQKYKLCRWKCQHFCLLMCSHENFSMNVPKENWGSEEEEYHIMRFTTISIFYEKTKFMKQAHFSLRKKMYQVTSMPQKLCHHKNAGVLKRLWYYQLQMRCLSCFPTSVHMSRSLKSLG